MQPLPPPRDGFDLSSFCSSATTSSKLRANSVRSGTVLKSRSWTAARVRVYQLRARRLADQSSAGVGRASLTQLVPYCHELTHRAHHLRRERLTIVSGIGNFVVEADILATRRSEVLLEEPLELFGRTYDLCAGGR